MIKSKATSLNMALNNLKYIVMFFILLVSAYLMVSFVEANREPVVVAIGNYRTDPSTLGFVVLSSVLVGMFIAGILFGIEVAYLLYLNQRLKKQVQQLNSANTGSYETTAK